MSVIHRDGLWQEPILVLVLPKSITGPVQVRRLACHFQTTADRKNVLCWKFLKNALITGGAPEMAAQGTS